MNCQMNLLKMMSPNEVDFLNWINTQIYKDFFGKMGHLFIMDNKTLLELP